MYVIFYENTPKWEKKMKKKHTLNHCCIMIMIFLVIGVQNCTSKDPKRNFNGVITFIAGNVLVNESPAKTGDRVVPGQTVKVQNKSEYV